MPGNNYRDIMGRPEFSPDEDDSVVDFFQEANSYSAASGSGAIGRLTETFKETRTRIVAGVMAASLVGGIVISNIGDPDGPAEGRGPSSERQAAPADRSSEDSEPDEIDFRSMRTTSTVPLEAVETTIAELAAEAPPTALPTASGTRKTRNVSATPTTTNESHTERQRHEAAEAELAAERQRREAAEAELAAERQRQADAEAAERQRQVDAAEAERQRQEAAAEAERQRQAKRLRWCNKLAEIAVEIGWEQGNGEQDVVVDIGLINGKTYRYSEMYREDTFYSYTEARNTYRVKVVDCSDKITRAEFGLVDNITDGQTPAWWEPEA